MALVLNCGFRFQKRVDVSWHRALQLAVRCCPVIPHVGASPRRGGELGTGKEESNHRSTSSPPVPFTHSRVALKDETHDPQAPWVRPACLVFFKKKKKQTLRG